MRGEYRCPNCDALIGCTHPFERITELEAEIAARDERIDDLDTFIQVIRTELSHGYVQKFVASAIRDYFKDHPDKITLEGLAGSLPKRVGGHLKAWIDGRVQKKLGHEKAIREVQQTRRYLIGKVRDQEIKTRTVAKERDAARARVRELEAALVKYGHWYDGPGRSCPECMCGLADDLSGHERSCVLGKLLAAATTEPAQSDVAALERALSEITDLYAAEIRADGGRPTDNPAITRALAALKLIAAAQQPGAAGKDANE